MFTLRFLKAHWVNIHFCHDGATDSRLALLLQTTKRLGYRGWGDELNKGFQITDQTSPQPTKKKKKPQNKNHQHSTVISERREASSVSPLVALACFLKAQSWLMYKGKGTQAENGSFTELKGWTSEFRKGEVAEILGQRPREKGAKQRESSRICIDLFHLEHIAKSSKLSTWGWKPCRPGQELPGQPKLNNSKTSHRDGDIPV